MNHNIEDKGKKSMVNNDIENMSAKNGPGNQKYNCELIQDLLPLYQDSVCSASSRAIVEEHLAECADCSKISEQLKSNAIEKELYQEKNSVLAAHSRQERKRTFTIGLCTAGILMIPVIVCLICNLAIGHALDWFFIVLSSLLLTASLTVVPLIVQEKRGLWTLGCFVSSLLLLLFTVCIYTKGHWFFLAAVPTLFGLSIIFAPYVLCSLNLPEPLNRCKGLITMLWDTLWLYALILVCGLSASQPGYWRPALEITSFCLLLPWALFLIIRYSHLPALTKAGVCTLISGIFGASVNSVAALILREPAPPVFHNGLLIWSNVTVNTVTSFLFLITTIPAGIILIAAGLAVKRRQGTGNKRV